MAIHQPPAAFQAAHPPHPDMADLVRAAHAERPQALKDILLALFGRRPPKAESKPDPRPARWSHPTGCA